MAAALTTGVAVEVLVASSAAKALVSADAIEVVFGREVQALVTSVATEVIVREYTAPTAFDQLLVNKVDAVGADRSAELALVKQGDTLLVDDGVGNTVQVEVTGLPVDHPTYVIFPFPIVTPASEPADDAPVNLSWARGTDTYPPPDPVIFSVEPDTVIDVDGRAATSFIVSVGYTAPPPGLTDLASYVLESTRFRDSTNPDVWDWSQATVWLSQSENASGTLPTPVVHPNVLAKETYAMRVYAQDESGNRSGPSPVVETESSEDSTAPPPPAGIVLQAGFSTINVRWDQVLAADFAYTEVQWRPAGGNWTAAQIAGTLMVLTGLTNGVTYDVRLRSVDFSGNTLLVSTGDVTTKATDPDAGWVDAGSATPVAPPGVDLGDGINADWLDSGTIRVGGTDMVDAIEVYDVAGALIGKWSEDGLEAYDPASPAVKLHVDDGGLYIYDMTDPLAPVTVVAITPRGIDAASITFGTARGGHNLVVNSAFETGAFSATDLRNQTWDVAADWNASRQSETNVTTGAGALTMTTVV